MYTVGTLITALQTLNITAALAGLAAVLVFAAVLAALIVRAGRKVRSDYSLAGRNINTKETAVVR